MDNDRYAPHKYASIDKLFHALQSRFDSGFGRVGAQNGGERFWAGSLQNERDSVFTYGI